MPLYQLDNLSLGYKGKTVLHNLTLSIEQGEKVALVGPSGAGKSTLLNHLYECNRETAALCPQGNGLVDLLSAYHNIFMGGIDRFGRFASLLNLVKPNPKAKVEINQLASQLGLSEQLWQSVDRLSGGQRQRVALGRALYRKQAVFMGDEPVSALDPQQAETLLQYVLSQHQTAIVCMHNPTLTSRLFDRVIALKDGRLAYDGPAKALSNQDYEVLYGEKVAQAVQGASSRQVDELPLSCIAPGKPPARS